MSIPARTKLVPIPDSVKSSYPIGGAREKLVPVSRFGGGADMVPSDVCEAIITLHEAVMAAGGDFRITDARRSVDSQAAARKKYENWLNAGKPGRHDADWDEATMKNAFVSKPGFSWHNAGRAIDIHIQEKRKPIVFPKADVSQQLDLLWPITRAIGWKEIIKAPDEFASEAWHFDLMGEWRPVYDRLGYKDGAMCAALDIGVDCYGRDFERLVQSQLHRAGYDVGEVDGWAGKKTKAGLKKAGLGSVEELKKNAKPLFSLPSKSCAVWKA
jgi:hypothetical protein